LGPEFSSDKVNGSTLGASSDTAGINVNSICPGYIETERLQKVFAAGGEDANLMRAKLADEVAMRRIGSVDDIANLVAFLVSPRGNYITGTAIQVDGGLFRGLR
jgi:3-oxoacyl-[acyl-carrier protein] reductase